jgi:acyl dehydratase
VTTPTSALGSAAPRRSIAAAIVGLDVGPFVANIDARWLMAYAAALGERDPRAFDTAAADGPVAHPLFSVCYEWPAMVAVREKVVAPALAPLGVHATHRVRIHRPPRAGDRLATTARVVGLEARRAGALLRVHLATVDADGAPVTETEYGSLFRGVSVEPAPGGSGGGVVEVPRSAMAVAPPTDADARWSAPIEVSAGAAHVYSECARIWNPIHTDIAVARAAGLPELILHGTATLALAVSRVVARDVGDAGRVRAVGGRFTGMVTMPSTLTVRGRAIDDGVIPFDVVDADGRPVLSAGEVAA